MAALFVPPPSSSSSSSPSSVPFPWPNERSGSPSPPHLMEDLQCPQPSPSPSIDPGEDFAASSRNSHASAPPPPSLLPAPASSSPSKVAAGCVAPTLLHLSFNQDQRCFAAGTDRGFRIYNCEPFQQIFRRDLEGRGIGIVEMLFRCNFIALVGGGSSPYQPPNKVMIWDDHESRCIGELSFRTEVLAVRLRRDRIIVVFNQKISVYNFADLKLVHQIETMPNPRGLCVVSQQQGTFVLACPGSLKGQVRVEHCEARRTKFIMAHDSRLACFALSQDGRLLATASTKGTLIRIFSTTDGTLLQEVRRGADRAKIYSMAFSADMKWLAVSSDKGTIHVFSLKVNLGSTVNDKPHLVPDPSSQFSFIKGMLPKYFKSEWSVAQFRLCESLQYVVAFGSQKNTVVILGMDGSVFLCQFDPEAGGDMTQLECYNFLKADA